MPTIGTDPEFFIRNLDTGTITPCVGIVGGNKANPVPLPHLPEGFGVQEDNVMCELTVPPALGSHAFADNMQAGMEGINNMLAEYNYELSDVSSVHQFNGNQLRSPQAAQFGCSPDYDAYERGARRRRIRPEDIGYSRFCGGHIHLGGQFNCPEFVSAMLADAALGCWAIYNGERQAQRRQYYGLPGLYRPTAYGIEYRTVSNFWAHNRDLTYIIGSRAIQLAALLEDTAEAIREVHMRIDWNEVRSVIVNEDRNGAQAITRVIDGVLERYPG